MKPKWKTVPNEIKRQIGSFYSVIIMAIFSTLTYAPTELQRIQESWNPYFIWCPLIITSLGLIPIITLWKNLDNHGGIRKYVYPCVGLFLFSLIFCLVSFYR